MSVKSDIIKLINTDDITPSLIYWVQLLNFFEFNVDKLDIDDVRLLCIENERCRLYWNEDKEEENKIRSGLNIEQKDVTPNIYAHLAEMERREKHSEAKKQTVQPIPKDHQMVPMAATA